MNTLYYAEHKRYEREDFTLDHECREEITSRREAGERRETGLIICDERSALVIIIEKRFLILSGIFSGPRLTAGANTVDNKNEILNLSSMKWDIS